MKKVFVLWYMYVSKLCNRYTYIYMNVMEPYRSTNTKNINACSMIFLRTVHSNISNHNNDNNTKDDKTAAQNCLEHEQQQTYIQKQVNATHPNTAQQLFQQRNYKTVCCNRENRSLQIQKGIIMISHFCHRKL